jgi:hydrogenase nickel incorporation protein HypA/HybF
VHEYSLVQDLLDQVATHARGLGATAVRKVTVGMGELAGVDPELFATAFETFRATAGPCRETELVVRWVEARWLCPECARPIERGAVLRCQDCKKPARLAAGDELTLERIELEIPEPHILRADGGSGARPDD